MNRLDDKAYQRQLREEAAMHKVWLHYPKAVSRAIWGPRADLPPGTTGATGWLIVDEASGRVIGNASGMGPGSYVEAWELAAKGI